MEVEEKELLDAVAGHLRVVLSRAVSVAELMAANAERKGVKLRVSYESAPSASFSFTLPGAPLQRGVSASITLYVLESAWGARETEKYVRARVKALERYFDYLKEQLEEEGIRCEVKRSKALFEEGTLRYATLNATFEVKSVDKGKVLSDPSARRRVLYGSYRWVGRAPLSLIKWLEAEAGAETAGESGQGGESGEREGDALEGVEVKEGWIRLIDAVVEFDIPFTVLDKMAKEGKLQVKWIPDPNGTQYRYVKLDEVGKLLKQLRKASR